MWTFGGQPLAGRHGDTQTNKPLKRDGRVLPRDAPCGIPASHPVNHDTKYNYKPLLSQALSELMPSTTSQSLYFLVVLIAPGTVL